MADEPPTPTPNILSLPEELRHLILLSSPDVPSLRALALSCSELYSTFIAHEREITSTVLSRHIRPDVIYDARIALAASRLCRNKPDAVSGFIKEFLMPEHKQVPSQEWNLADALAAYALHMHVVFFMQTFADTILRQPPFISNTPSEASTDDASNTSQSLSEDEQHRFQRALYRFETLGFLYRSQSRSSFDYVTAMWLSRLARFELEQLATINDLLTYLIAPAFNDIALHDISWGCFRVNLITDVDSWNAQYVVSRGLAFVHSIIQDAETGAETSYTQYYRILHNGDQQEDEPGIASFLYDKLQNPPPFHTVNEEDDGHEADDDENNEDDDDVAIPISVRTARDALSLSLPISWARPSVQRTIFGTPFYPPDHCDDPGPAKVFAAFHIDTAPRDLVQNGLLAQHRRWAYVFWDEARLVQIGALPGNKNKKEWKEQGLTKLETPTNPLKIYVDIPTAEIEASWTRRTAIREQRGTGWWSADDESKVVWPKKKKKMLWSGRGRGRGRGQQQEGQTVQSLQEAKAFLRSL